MPQVNYRTQFWFQALFMGIFMFLIMECLIPYAENEVITGASLRKGALVWGLFGLLSGAVHVGLMRWSARKQEGSSGAK